MARGPSIRPRVLVAPLGVWALMAVLAVLNGGVREAVLEPSLGEYPGHVLSTATLVAAILVLSWWFFRRSETAYTRRELLAVGVLWTVLTVAFEFLVGWAGGSPVSATLAQYDVTAGQVWIAVPLALLVAPLAFGRGR